MKPPASRATGALPAGLWPKAYGKASKNSLPSLCLLAASCNLWLPCPPWCGSHAKVASPLSKEVELMAEEPNDPSLFPWGFQRGQVPQASPSAVKPPLRPHPKPSNGTQGNQIGGSKPEGQ